MKLLLSESLRNRNWKLKSVVLVPSLLLCWLLIAFSCVSKKNIQTYQDDACWPIKIWQVSIHQNADNDLSKGDEGIKIVQQLDLIDLKPIQHTAVVANHQTTYELIAHIWSEEAHDRVFMLGSKANAQVYCDQNKIQLLSDRGGLQQYSRYYKITLKQGANVVRLILTFETNQKNHRFCASLGTEQFAINNHHERYWNDFLEESIIEEEDAELKFQLPTLSNQEVRLHISGQEISESYNLERGIDGFWTKSLKGWVNGLYQCDMSLGNMVYRQEILLGDAKVQLSELKNKTKSCSKESLVRETLEPLLERGNHLMKYRAHLGQRKAFYQIESSLDGSQWSPHGEGASDQTSIQGNGHVLETKARYLKVIGKGNTFHDWSAIAEVEAYGEGFEFSDESKPLVIRNLSVSSYEGDHYAANVYDRELNTAWEARGEGEWLMLDLEREVDIHRLEIAWKRSVGESRDVRAWQRKMVYVLSELELALNYDDPESQAYHNIPGRHLLGYTSSADQQMKNFIVQVPDGYKEGNQYPMVLHVLPRVETPALLIKSYLMANTIDLDRSQLVSNHHQVIDVWTFADSYEPYVYPHGVEEFNSTIKEVKSKYQIDTDRIYLMSTCSGFIKALQLAEAWPDRFAAIASSPMLFENDTTLKIFDRLSNIKNIPIYIHHARYDELTPYESMEHFQTIATTKELDIKVNTLENTSRAFYVPDQYDALYEKLLRHERKEFREFEWVGYERKQSPFNWLMVKGFSGNETHIKAVFEDSVLSLKIAEIDQVEVDGEEFRTEYGDGMILNVEYGDTRMMVKDTLLKLGGDIKELEYYSKNECIEGPIHHLFSKPFVLVPGTIGTEAETFNNYQLSEQFVDFWKSKRLSDCEIVDDQSPLVANGNCSGNMVLVGDVSSHAFLKKYADRLPFSDELDTQGIVYIYPNPNNPSTYILVLNPSFFGDLNEQSFSFLVNNGFDYVFYGAGAIGFFITYNGLFDSNWKI